ncbi:hypothetical protein EI94DRAFT_1705332 [Lactarius quietus]|nr:hypothetical protein EI94DRAFT_1705332 [Lactarius quietus]
MALGAAEQLGLGDDQWFQWECQQGRLKWCWGNWCQAEQFEVVACIQSRQHDPFGNERSTQAAWCLQRGGFLIGIQDHFSKMRGVPFEKTREFPKLTKYGGNEEDIEEEEAVRALLAAEDDSYLAYDEACKVRQLNPQVTGSDLSNKPGGREGWNCPRSQHSLIDVVEARKTHRIQVGSTCSGNVTLRDIVLGALSLNGLSRDDISHGKKDGQSPALCHKWPLKEKATMKGVN